MVRHALSSQREDMRRFNRSTARHYTTVIAALISASLLMLASGCSSCNPVTPVTNEKKGPDLVLNLLDVSNLKNSQKNIPPSPAAPLTMNEPNYNWLFLVIATDPGGVSSLDYSEVFNTGCPCNPNSNTCPGSTASGSETYTPNPDLLTMEFAAVAVSAAAEKSAVGCPSTFQGNVPGTYTIKAKATNPSGKKTEHTWTIVIPPAS
jgi:hypothetical protein